MSPPIGGNTTGSSSRRSSTSSNSTPFATPPTSPMLVSHPTRIPKPSAASAIPGPSASTRSPKMRSHSASAGAGNTSTASALLRTGPSRGVLQPSASAGTRRPSLPGLKTEGIMVKPGSGASSGNISSSASTSKNTGLGSTPDLVPKLSSRVPIANGPSAVAGSSSGISRVPASTSSPTAAGLAMKRTKSAEGSARSKTAPAPASTALSSEAEASSSSPAYRGPRKQRSASSLPRRTLPSPRAPVPPVPSPHNQTKSPPPAAPSISVSQPTPVRSQQPPSRIPWHSSPSQSSPTASTISSRRRSRANTPVSHSKSPPSTIDLTDDAPGPLDDRRPVRPNGFGRRKSGDSANSASPSSRPASRNASPSAKGSGKSSSPALSGRQPGSSRGGRGSPHASTPSPRAHVPALPESSRRPRLLRNQSGEQVARSRIPEPQQSAPSADSAESPILKSSPSLTGPSAFVFPGDAAQGSHALGRRDSDATASPGDTPQTSPRRRGTALPTRSPRTSPRNERKLPPLTIAPMPSLSRQHSRRISMPPPDSKASPPVPAKSPLRALGGTSSRRSSRSLASSPVPPTSPVPPVPPLPDEMGEGLCLVQGDPPGDYLTAVAIEASPIQESRPSLASLSSTSSSLSLSSSSSSFGGASASAMGGFATTPSRSTTPNPSTPTPAASQTPPAVHRPLAQSSPRPVSPPLLTSLSMPNTSFDTPDRNGDGEGDADTSSAGFPSPYSQDSAPPSAPASSVNLWAIGSAERDNELSELSSPVAESDISRDGNEMEEILNDSAMYAAQKRTSNISSRPKRTAEPITPLGSKFDLQHNKALPRTPTPHTPTTPGRPVERDPQMRSPSMPTVSNRPAGTMPNGSKAEAPLGSPNFPRSRTGPVNAGGLQPAAVLASRPHSMMATGLTAPPSPILSRRAHLLREIVHTERSHATDLALIRDAYLGGLHRPDSQHSQGTSGASITGASMVTSLGDSTTSTATTPTTPAQESRHSRHSRHSRRSSSYGGFADDSHRISGHERNSGYERTSGYLVEKLESRTSHDGKRGSGHERRPSGQDSPWSTAWNGLMSPGLKSPREHTHHNGGSIDSLYGGSSGAASNSSLQMASPLMASPRIPSTPSSTNGMGRVVAPPGRPLTAQDIKTVFINIAQLAQISEELATLFENALGSVEDEAASPGGEGGSDRIGEVFSRILHRLRPLYTQYCSRHSVAHQRLVELQGHPATAAYLNDCWLKVKSRTHAWNLDSMLIKPVQRVTKYPLLFEDLLASTTPVHPDYYAIKASAEGARALALEIDEVKRRKDVINSVIGKSSSTVNLVKEAKGPGHGGRLLGLRRFKKDKGQGSGSDPLALLDISPYAQSQLKELVTRLKSNQENIRKLGKQVVEWTESSRLMVVSDMELNRGFIKWHSLRSRVTNDPRLERVAAYQGVMDTIINQSWEEMNEQIQNSVLPIMGKLLESPRNPLIVVDKLNRKSADYARYVAHRQAKKNIERLLMQEATEYVSIHTQLLEELPAFLEGWKRIFDLAMVAFTRAQTQFYGSVRDQLVIFTAQYLSEPIEEITDGNGIKAVPIDISTPRGLHKAWHDSWHEPNATVRGLEITGGDGSRSGTLRSTPKFANQTWDKSPRAPPLATLPSSESSSLSLLAPPSSGNRRRSMSLMAPPQSTTPLSEQRDHPPRPDSASARSVVGIFRRNSHRDSSSRKGLGSSRRSSREDGALTGKPFPGSDSRSATPATLSTPATPNSATLSPPPLNQRHSHTQLRQQTLDRARTRSSRGTAASQEEKERHSFGLPRIPTDGNHLLDLGVTSPLEMTFSGLGLGLDLPVTPPPPPAPTRPPPPAPIEADTEMDPSDPSETWRASKVLYACAAVADFNPMELGNQKFKGLSFLPIMAGDLVDVFHEIGRVADLTDFPYSQVGVENDGAVVCRSENGTIGVAMCSFLEPLRM